MATTIPPPPPIERTLEVETPEHVAIAYGLADLGSRFVALLLDALILLLVLAAVWIVPLAVVSQLGEVAPMLAGWGLGALVLLSFVITWGYFIYFEGLRDGQTPGKRRLGIRVVHDGGYPLTLRGAAVRNLVRLVDIQPMPACLVGGVVMMLHPRTQRLGDLAAATLVVRERGHATLPEESAATGAAAGPPRLEPAEFEALAGYAARRQALDPEVRLRIAGRLVERLQQHAPWDRSTQSADRYLLALHEDESARRSTAVAGTTARAPAAAALVRRQRETWAEYQALVGRAQARGLNWLSERELSRFAALYRETAADLARARTYGASRELLYTLERLVAAGHNLLYRPSLRSARQLAEWFRSGFPALVRLRWRPILLAAVIFYLPAVVAFAAIRLDPPRAREMLPAEMLARAESGVGRDAEGRGYIEMPPVAMPVMATSIVANNVQVTFVAFAGGVLAGLGTVAILVFNGVFLGGVAALFANHGLSLYLWTFVLPHGIIELTAIVIAGGAGLWLGSAMVLPGRRTRREALAVRGREAVALLSGTVLLLVVAGFIEGFISPAAIPRPLKLGFAAIFALLLFLYLLVGGRGTEARGRAEDAGRVTRQ
jgi:uncharacterized membrane protein SpoIIM required for sporulation/uncharacterized RDD family membrane protein YckC